MRILVTNDDGINAPGLAVLLEIAAELSDDVWCVAPMANKSGAGHSLTLHEPLRLDKIDARTFAVSGTPTDCVIMGLRHILRESQPDLILSGINNGANLAEDITMSGTVAATIEGTVFGVRSIAMSQTYGFSASGGIQWDTARAFGPGLVRTLLDAQLPNDVFINVNFPDALPDAVAGTVVTRQGRRDQKLLDVDERFDTWGNPYYWFDFARHKSNPAEGTDLWAIYKNMISVTPLHANLTHDATMAPLNEMLARQLDVRRKSVG